MSVFLGYVVDLGCNVCIFRCYELMDLMFVYGFEYCFCYLFGCNIDVEKIDGFCFVGGVYYYGCFYIGNYEVVDLDVFVFKFDI